MSNKSVGIDIGVDYAKVVCLEKDSAVPRLAGYGLVNYRGDKAKLKKFFADSGIKFRDVRINIEDPSLRIRRLDLPIMPDEEVGESIKWGLKDIVDGNVEDYVFREVRIPPEDLLIDKKMPVVVFAVGKSAIESVYKNAKELGLPAPQIIEPDAGALAVLFNSISPADRASYEVIIDLGSKVSLFTVMGRQGILYSRSLVGSSDSHLVDQIARDMGVKIADAEAYKNLFFGETGEDSKPEKDADVRLKNTVSHFYSRVALEIQRSMDGFSLLFEAHKIGKMHLCGGGAYYGGLVECLKQTLGIEIKITDPFVNMDLAEYSGPQIGSIKKRGAIFAVACGLALE